MLKAFLTIGLSFLLQNLVAQAPKSQEFHIVRHQVQMGETVKMLSQKYMTPPSEIYNLNKFAVDGITKGMVLQIPVPVKDSKSDVKSAETQDETALKNNTAADIPLGEEINPETISANNTINHLVTSGETLSGLARKYGVTISELKDANPKVAKRGLRADEIILITASQGVVPANGEATLSADPVSAGEVIEHLVQSGETLSGLAEKYQVPITEIQKQNKKMLKRGLQVGQVLKITKL